MAKHNIIKRARRILKGLILTWQDDAPEKEDNAPKFKVDITHKNPNLRPIARSIFNDFRQYIYFEAILRWRVIATTVFVYPNGMEQREETELEAFTRLADLNPLVLAEIAHDKRYGEHFSHVEFYVECLSEHPTKSIAA